MVGYKHLGKWQRSNRFLPGWLRRPSMPLKSKPYYTCI